MCSEGSVDGTFVKVTSSTKVLEEQVTIRHAGQTASKEGGSMNREGPPSPLDTRGQRKEPNTTNQPINQQTHTRVILPMTPTEAGWYSPPGLQRPCRFPSHMYIYLRTFVQGAKIRGTSDTCMFHSNEILYVLWWIPSTSISSSPALILLRAQPSPSCSPRPHLCRPLCTPPPGPHAGGVVVVMNPLPFQLDAPHVVDWPLLHPCARRSSTSPLPALPPRTTAPPPPPSSLRESRWGQEFRMFYVYERKPSSSFCALNWRKRTLTYLN